MEDQSISQESNYDANGKEVLDFENAFTEEVSPHFFNGELIQPTIQVYRFNMPMGGRLYFVFEDQEHFQKPKIYMGTGLVLSGMPTAKELQKYREKLGTEASDHELAMWSLYGSFSDTEIGNFIRRQEIEDGMDGLALRLKEYFYTQQFFINEREFNHMAKCIKKDMLGFLKFVKDRNVEFVFTQFPVISEIDQMITPIDIGCFMDIWVEIDKFNKDGSLSKNKAKEVQRVFSLINYKSGAIYKNYALQCRAEINMFKENYPEFTNLPIQVYNLTITEWKNTNSWDKYHPCSYMGKPYTLKRWDEEDNEDDFRDYLSIAKRKLERKLHKKISVISGTPKIGDNATDFITSKTVLEIIQDGTWQKFQKSSASLPEELISQTL